MGNYLFETQQLGVTDKSFELMRRKFVFGKIDFDQVTEMKIERDKELPNWGLVLAFGFVVLFIGLLYATAVISYFTNDDPAPIHIEEIAAPVISVVFGIGCIYFSLRNATVLKFTINSGKRYKYSLRQIETVGQLEEFRKFLKC